MTNLNHPVIGLTLNYRDAQRTAYCVESILAEGVGHVLVWDNSADNGHSSSELQGLLKGNAQITIQISDENLGFAAGVNRGARFILDRFPDAWILILNNDAYLMPNAVMALASALRNHAQTIVAYPDIDHAGTIHGTGYYHRLTGLLTRTRLPGSFSYASGCCQLIAPERTTLPIFDEAFFMYGEDWLQGWMLGSARMAHVPRTLVFHEGSQSSGLGSEFYENRMAAAHWLLAYRAGRTSVEKSLLLGTRLLTLSIRALIRSMRFRNTTPLLALRRGWKIARHANARR